MKKYCFLIICLLLGYAVNAQVGVNVKDTRGILHVDPNNNTDASGTLTDDIIISGSVDAGGVSVAIGGDTIQGTSVALVSPNMGFVPNKVQLTSIQDRSTISSPIEGMVVYNKESAGVPPNDVRPGYYVYIGSSSTGTWQFATTQASTPDKRYLTASAVTSATTTPNNTNGTQLVFQKSVTIDEDGVYGFMFNFRGTTTSTQTVRYIHRTIFYVHMFRVAAGTTSEVLVDMVELNPPYFTSASPYSGQAISFNTPMAGTFKGGDRVVVRISKYDGGVNPVVTLLSGEDGTTLTYWKLQ